ncbi:unnamed protein product [Rotaria sordida]|uniref:F-box domain-containing protein n=1 Tax=Rotaria sordida TaxID=392033 RepID=A0A813RAH0_9BILA|nr:unnamed protein product [Rotaria sordida]
MFQFKRRLHNNKSFDEQIKKSRTTYDDKKIISYFENLSNELFYEIFDYLDGYEIYKAFSNLNTRFEVLLTSSSLRLKIDLRYQKETILQYCSTYVVVPNKHRIISLRSSNHDDYNSEMFLTNVSPQLEVLRIDTFRDVTYLDANRWERIISRHLLHLNIFEFKYEELIDEDLETTIYHERLNEFKSPIQGNSYKNNEGAESFINEIGQNMSVPCKITAVLCTESNVK